MTERVYDNLKRDLITWRYKPGEALHEAALAAAHKVSKTPVREALNLLAREGYVDVLARHGYIVSPISVKDVQDIFQLRLMVEPAAAGLAAGKINEEQLRHLKTLSRISYRFGDPRSYADFLSANREFHTAVAWASGNGRLAALIERLLEDMERFFHLGLGLRDSSGEMVHEHDDLVGALVGGNADLAEKIMCDQIIESRRRVIEAIISDSDRGALSLRVV
ncbi:MAG: GntR family transcriptional regulator [Candidatus Dormibacteria bacterium]